MWLLTRCDMLRATAFAAAASIAGLSGVGRAVAHHGWAWATDKQFDLTGIVKAARLGNPHGEITLDANGEEWIAEVGQPWRNERAGLTRELLAVGTEVTVSGHRAKDPAKKLVKAERVIIAGKTYDLYPDRSS